MSQPSPQDLDTWADTLHTMNTAEAPPPNLLTVACPTCGVAVAIVPDGRFAVSIKPAVSGPGWTSVRLTVTATGSALHTHAGPA